MNRAVLDKNLKLIANTINLNLSYLNSVSSSINILESSLQFPLLECMERRIKYKEVALEYPHPTFKNKRCDLCWKDEEGNKCLMELKYKKNNKGYENLILKDLIRLYFTLNKNYYAFFLLCTKYGDGEVQNFENANYLSKENVLAASVNTSTNSSICESPYGKWLSSNIDQRNITVKFKKTTDVFYQEIAESYSFIDNNSFPDEISFETRLVCQTMCSENTPLTHQVEIWEILKCN